MKKFAVLMTCYNRVATTLECLRRLYAQNVPDGYSFEVWLVDDASPDRTGEKVKAAYPQVNVICSSGNLFWCKGMRLAWEKAANAYDYDGYLWLNDDTMMLDGALATLLDDARGTGNAIIAGAVSDPATGCVCYGAKDAQGIVVPNGSVQRATHHLNGNVLLVTRGAFERIGMIDGAYLHGSGDYDYGRMAERAGVAVFVSSRVVGSCSYNKGKSGTTASLSLPRRWRLLFSPLGFPLHDTWHYRMKFDGFVRAVASCLHVMYLVMSGKR